MIISMIRALILVVVACATLTACVGEEKQRAYASGKRGALLSSQVIEKKQVATDFRLLKLAARSNRSYDIEVVKLRYLTALESGDIISASGVVVVPQNKPEASSVLSYQPATIFLDSDAPSLSPLQDMTPILLASAGLVVMVPDYIGYGDSSGQVHPYLQAVPAANSVLDLIRAARIYLDEQGVAVNQQLYLAGYAEGGYASLAAHREMEQQYPAEFQVAANLVGGGIYDVRATMDAVLLNQSRLEAPAHTGFLIHAYHHYYDLEQLTLRAVASPYQRVVDQYYTGQYSKITINSLLARQHSEFFNSEFLAEYAGLSGEWLLKRQLDHNNVYDWAPRAKVRLFHSQADRIAPYQNAVTALSVMTNNHAQDASLTDCNRPQGSHEQCANEFSSFVTNYLLKSTAGR